MDQQVVDRLKEISLFAALAEREKDLAEFLPIVKILSVTAGTTVIKEGEVGEELYVVYRGGVEIRKKTRAGDNYTVTRLRAEQSVFFGELALVDDDSRSATVVATEDSEFLIIKKKDFLSLGDRRPDICLPVTRAIAQNLASRLRKTNEDMMTIFDALVNEIEG
jgi:CRP-like cAMP-binding protein